MTDGERDVRGSDRKNEPLLACREERSFARTVTSRCGRRPSPPTSFQDAKPAIHCATSGCDIVGALVGAKDEWPDASSARRTASVIDSEISFTRRVNASSTTQARSAAAIARHSSGRTIHPSLLASLNVGTPPGDCVAATASYARLHASYAARSSGVASPPSWIASTRSADNPGGGQLGNGGASRSTNTPRSHRSAAITAIACDCMRYPSGVWASSVGKSAGRLAGAARIVRSKPIARRE